MTLTHAAMTWVDRLQPSLAEAVQMLRDAQRRLPAHKTADDAGEAARDLARLGETVADTPWEPLLNRLLLDLTTLEDELPPGCAGVRDVDGGTLRALVRGGRYCEGCGSEMTLRTGVQRGWHWGCTRFPLCWEVAELDLVA